MIGKQISEGRIDALAGETCDALIGIGDGKARSRDQAVFAMMRSGQRWFRFTIDVGVLFFDPAENSATSGEIDDDDRVLDLLPQGGPFEIEAIEFEDGMLEISFVEGWSLRFREDAETAAMVVG